MYVIQNFFGKVGTVKARSTLINLSVAHQLCRFFKNPFYAQHKKQSQTQHLKKGMSKSMQEGEIKKGFDLMKPFTVASDPGETRTLGPLIKSQLLYQLSYGVKGGIQIYQYLLQKIIPITISVS